MKKKLIIMCGLPGSGKSYEANQILKEAIETQLRGVIYSTDDYWISRDGSYVFVPDKIGIAHEWNRERTENAILSEEFDVIIIDNTNTTEWERNPYVKMGNDFGYEIEYRQSTSPWWTTIYENIKNNNYIESDLDILVEKNTHGVPRGVISKMMKRYNFPE